MRAAVFLMVAAGVEAGALTATVTPALDGWFRPGRPVLLRVHLRNEGQAATGTVDLVVEGITYRRPFVAGAEARVTVDVLVAVHGPRQEVRVRAKSGAGHVFCDERMVLELKQLERGQRLVVGVGEGRKKAGRLFASGTAVAAVALVEMPGTAMGLAAADAVVLGIEEELPPMAKGAVMDWVRQGGTLVLVAAGRVEDEEGVQAEVERAGREWLPGGQVGLGLEGGEGTAWELGLGQVVAAAQPEGLRGTLETVVASPVMGVGESNPGLYEWFGPARLTAAVRWRWVAIGAALVLAAAVGGRALLRSQGRGAAVLGILACALLAAGAWGVLAAGGRGTVAAAAVRALGRDGRGAAAEVVQVGGAGRDRVRLAFNRASAVVPAYYSPEDVGTWDDVVLEQDAEGGWSLRCDVERGVRRCFVAMAEAREAAAADRGKGLRVRGGRFALGAEGTWRSLRELDEAWDGPAPLVRWQARRMGARRGTYEVRWRPREESTLWTRGGVAVMRPGPEVEWVVGE